MVLPQAGLAMGPQGVEVTICFSWEKLGTLADFDGF
jgi:hypothetical protein